MKKLFLLFCLFISSLSLFAQEIYIKNRVAGSGTSISVPIYNSGDNILEGFVLTIQGDSIFSPNYFNLDYQFYSHGWLSVPGYTNQQLIIAAVGNPLMLTTGEQIGQMNIQINKNLSGNFGWPTISFYDSKNYWALGYDPLKIINIPFGRYDDLNNDSTRDITDNIISFKLAGTISDNDTINVANDLDGDGYNTTYDTQLGLSITVTPSTAEYLPIFQNYHGGGGMGVERPIITPMTTTWKKMSGDKWGLYSEESVTNGDLVNKENSNISLPSVNNMMFKKIDNKIYFVGQKGVVNSPIIVSDAPVALTGTLNNGRQIIVLNPTGIVEKTTAPELFVLNQNYPNPFNPSTTISYQVPTNGMVTLKVYDILGKEVTTLVNEQKNAGVYSVKFNAANLTSGMYIYKIQAGNFTQTKKMLLMK